MDEKVSLSTNAISYAIEVDVEDLSLSESLTSRCERYSNENQAEHAAQSHVSTVTPAAPDSPANAQSSPA